MSELIADLEALASLALPEGGWGYAPDQGAHLEPTCLALLALARDLAPLDLVPLADAALRIGDCTTAALAAVAAGRRRGAPALRAVLPILDARSESAWESVLRLLHQAAEVDVVENDRGGKSTFHGPGQLVCYPILDLNRHGRDVKRYVRDLEEAVIRTGAAVGVEATRIEGLTGVWLESPPRKLASIGVHARDWVTWHGFALNVTTDLRYFDLIVPCGIDAVEMSSIGRELARRGEDSPGSDALVAKVKASVSAAFGDVFTLDVADMHPHALLRVA